MASLTRNAISGAAERIVSAALTILIVPLQVRVLGMEAYGLLGFVASLQVLFNILDLGLTPTVIREVAADQAPGRPRGRVVVQTLAAAYWAIAALIGVALAAGAPAIARTWVQADALPASTVEWSIRLIAVAVMLRWPVALYSGVMTGVQRLDLVNAVRIVVSLARLVGGIVVLLQLRTIESYLAWLALVGCLELLAYIIGAKRVMPELSPWPRVSAGVFAQLWRFSSHMSLLSILSVVLVQSDRFVISRALPIAELGFYTVAYSLASALSILQSVVTAALYPALADRVGRGDADGVRGLSNAATGVLMFVIAGLGLGLAFFGHPVLSRWISAATADRAALPLALLAVGFVASAAASIPYTLAVAAGRTGLPLVVNLFAVAGFLPGLVFAVQRLGIVGAAWAWLTLNVYYVCVMVPLILRADRLQPPVAWLFTHVLRFVFTGVAAFGLARLAAAWLGHTSDVVQLAWAVAGGLVYGATAWRFIDRAALRRLLASTPLAAVVQGPAAS